MDFGYHCNAAANIEVKNFHSPVPASCEYDVCRVSVKGSSRQSHLWAHSSNPLQDKKKKEEEGTSQGSEMDD